jgi:thiamine-monophosphate kinase
LDKAEDIGERKIIEIIWKNLDRDPRMAVPFGDDVSAAKYQGRTLAVLKTDMLVGKTDIPPRMSYWQAARKAVIMNISDLAAKGVKPLAILASLGIPRGLTRGMIVQIGKGLNAGAREYGGYVVGGDTNETEDLIISIAAMGLAEEGSLMLRNGANPGEIVATTGEFGLTSVGLRILKEQLAAPINIKKRALDAVFTPHARLREGLALAETGAVTASIDSSDGLAWSLHELSQASNLGIEIDNPPIARETFDFAGRHNFSALELSLYGGEEYELVVTIRPSLWEKAIEAVKRAGGRLIRIGRTVEKKGLFLQEKEKLVRIKARGYEHFGAERKN